MRTGSICGTKRIKPGDLPAIDMIGKQHHDLTGELLVSEPAYVRNGQERPQAL
jgi:hypothetical protein